MNKKFTQTQLDNWRAYEQVRASGRFNMTTEAHAAAAVAFLTKAEYSFVFKNFAELKKAWEAKSDDKLEMTDGDKLLLLEAEYARVVAERGLLRKSLKDCVSWMKARNEAESWPKNCVYHHAVEVLEQTGGGR